MKKPLLAMLTALLFWVHSYGQETDSLQLKIDAIEQSLKYQTGVIELESGDATLKVPAGFRFLDKEQSMYVLTDLWGNPADSSVLGMLVPVNRSLLEASGWAFTLSYDGMGYVEDGDAADIDYDDLLKDLKQGTAEENAERVKQGFQPIALMGWASKPYYDQDKRVLHWAKEIRFGQDSVNTLNYNLRVLGRKGIFVLNAVASMNELPEVKTNISKVIGSVTFNEGSSYADFDPDVDQVAAWSIGGLVAGKVLAKAGFFALLAKFWKLIFVFLASAGSYFWKFIRREKQQEEKVEEGSTEIEQVS